MEQVTIPYEEYLTLLNDQEILRQVLNALTRITEPALGEDDAHLKFTIGVHGTYAPKASFPTAPMRFDRWTEGA